MGRIQSVSHRGFPRSQARKTAWEEGTGDTTVTPVTASGSVFVGLAAASLADGITIIRTRGFFKVYQRVSTSAGDGFSGIFGIGVATFAAVSAGIASVPTPITEMSDENWLYLQMFDVRSGQIFSSGGAPGAEQNGIVHSFEIDSKAMRKFPSGMAIYAAIEVVETGTATMEVVHNSRTLLKLP